MIVLEYSFKCLSLYNIAIHIKYHVRKDVWQNRRTDTILIKSEYCYFENALIGEGFGKKIRAESGLGDDVKIRFVFEHCTFDGCQFNSNINDYNIFTEFRKPCKFYNCVGECVKGYMSCPTEGSFIAYKKIISKDNRELVAKLYIPEDAKRASGNCQKCRADKVKVLSINDIKTGNEESVGYSAVIPRHPKCTGEETEYKVGRWIYADSFEPSFGHICAHGIHFFLDKQQAIDYAIK